MARSNSIDNVYFALSGIFAVCLYVLLIFFILFVLFQTDEYIKISLNTPSKIESINVSLIEDVSLPKVTSNASLQTSNKNDTKSKDNGSKTPISGLGIGDLFDKIDTKNSQSSEIPIADNRDKVAINKKHTSDSDAIKNQKINEILQKTQNIQQTLANLNENIIITDSHTSAFCDKYKDYCDELMNLLYTNWHIKNSFDTILSSIVIVNINKDGIFSYTIKKKSNNEIFDNELVESLETLKDTRFPTLENIDIDKLEVTFRNKKE